MAESKKLQAAIAAFLTLCFLFIARAVAVGVHHIRISDAIYMYQLDCMDKDQQPLVWQADKESYGDTFRRWWDWSDHNILDKYADMRIRPYIGKADSTDFMDQYFGG